MVELKYKLEQKEIEESLFVLNWEKEGIRKVIHIYILSILGFILLIIYLKNPNNTPLLICIFLILLLTFTVMYLSFFRRKKKANELTKKEGNYYIQIGKDGILSGNRKDKYLFHNKKLEILESENVYTMKLDKHFICVPKRVLSENKKKEVVKILENIEYNILQFKTRER